MLCERCKIREANIQYTEVINGVKTEHNFCAQCAKEMDFGPYSAIFDGDFPLGKLLSGLLGDEDETKKKDKMNQIVCPTCKTSYEQFVTNSCFGCGDCYSVFGPLIGDRIRQLQGSDSHTGKHPRFQKMVYDSDSVSNPGKEGQENLKEQIVALNARLMEAVKSEDYEQAAVCRDQIKALKERKGSND